MTCNYSDFGPGGSTQLGRVVFLSIGLASAAMAQQPIVDGKLSDPLWRSAPPAKLAPSQAATSADLGGEIQVIVAGRYLCVAARLPEPTGRVTARLTGRNPSWEDEDRIRILAGADIEYTDRILTVNPLGRLLDREGRRVKIFISIVRPAIIDHVGYVFQPFAAEPLTDGAGKSRVAACERIYPARLRLTDPERSTFAEIDQP